MMDKVKKQEYIEKMSSQFDKSEAVIVTHYQGLTMQQLDDLRSSKGRRSLNGHTHCTNQ